MIFYISDINNECVRAAAGQLHTELCTLYTLSMFICILWQVLVVLVQ